MPKSNPKYDPSRANSSNPNNTAFWIKQGYSNRPENWRQLYESMGLSTSSKSRIEKRMLTNDWLGPLSKDDY